MLLLDTHTWVWFMQGSDKFNAATIKKIETGIQNRTVHIAAISQWELAMLIQKSRIVLNEPALVWMQSAIEKLHLKVLPLTADIAIESTELPGEFHGDPADRMIVSTARIHQLTILTRDAKILQYAQLKHVRAVEI